jgi:hypothetical protein
VAEKKRIKGVARLRFFSARGDNMKCLVADKAIHRLHKKYTRLAMRRKPSNVAITAVARELCGFVWNVMKDEAV